MMAVKSCISWWFFFDWQAGNMSDSCLIQTYALVGAQANWNNCLPLFWSNEEPRIQEPGLLRNKSNQCAFPAIASFEMRNKVVRFQLDCPPTRQIRNQYSTCFKHWTKDQGPQNTGPEANLWFSPFLVPFWHYEWIDRLTWGKLKQSLADLFLLSVHLMPHARCQRLLWSQPL